MGEIEKFEQERRQRIADNADNQQLQSSAKAFMMDTVEAKYSYNFSWMGRPIIQYPQDMVAMQEIMWQVKPDLIIETGIAHGGSLIMYASFMEMMGIDGKVLGIDIDIRQHNREAIESHPMFKRIDMIEGSSISEDVAQQVRDYAKNYKTILVALDSNHTHEHVLKELELYAPMTSVGSYCVVFDTIIEDTEPGSYPDRPWDVGDNPKTAVHAYLKSNDAFEIDREMDNKLLVSVVPEGFLKRVKD